MKGTGLRRILIVFGLVLCAAAFWIYQTIPPNVVEFRETSEELFKDVHAPCGFAQVEESLIGLPPVEYQIEEFRKELEGSGYSGEFYDAEYEAIDKFSINSVECAESNENEIARPSIKKRVADRIDYLRKLMQKN